MAQWKLSAFLPSETDSSPHNSFFVEKKKDIPDRHDDFNSSLQRRSRRLLVPGKSPQRYFARVSLLAPFRECSEHKAIQSIKQHQLTKGSSSPSPTAAEMPWGSVVNWRTRRWINRRLTKLPSGDVPIYLFFCYPTVVCAHFACQELLGSGSFAREHRWAVNTHDTHPYYLRKRGRLSNGEA